MIDGVPAAPRVLCQSPGGFICLHVCVYVRPLEETRVLRKDPAHQEEHKHEVVVSQWPRADVSVGILRLKSHVFFHFSIFWG